MDEIGIICLLPDGIRSYQEDLRQKIATQFRLFDVANPIIPAHITLKYHFPVESLAEIEQVVQEFCLTQSKTSLFLQGFNYFKNDDNYVVFIDVVATPETRNAHSRFLDRLREVNWVQWGPFDNTDLHYHVTLVANGITVENFEKVWAFVNQQNQPNFESYFDNITLIKIAENTGSVYKTYWLQNGKVD
jgi:2'-5' RNA ligase